jgi:replication factor A1
MSTQLTSEALARICQGEEVSEPLLQVLGNKAIAGSGQERFRLLLSDGVYTNSFSMLATQLNHMIHDNKLSQFSIIRVKKHVCNQMGAQGATGKRVVILLDLEVVTPGEQVGRKLGNPIQIGSDGVVPAAANQNANPNVGAATAPKRPSAAPLGGTANKVQASIPARSSVMQPRPSVGGASGVLTTPIASITPYQNKWTIKARITSKGDIRTWNKASGSGKLFSMDLMDESGEIRVTAFKEQCDKFYDLAAVGKVYYISNCSVKAANKQYSKLNNDYELTFKDNGTMELVEDDADDVPTMTYNFAKISDLSGAEKDLVVDVIGVCKSYGEAVSFVSRAGKEMVKRDVTLVDKSATEVNYTIWGTTATNFEGSGNPIIAAKGVRVSDFNGVSISGGDIMINPDMDIAHELKGWWDNEGCSAATQSITVQGMRSGGGDGGASKTIGEVKHENLGQDSDRGDYYSTTATVTFFQKDKAMYKSCGKEIDGKQCMKKVLEQGDGTYRCEKCAEEKSQFTWRIMLQLNMADCTDNTWASAFQDTAEKILNVQASELGRLLETDEEKYNQIFTDATFKAFSFRMRVKADTYNDETRLKHTVVDASELSWNDYCKKLITEIDTSGGNMPEKVSRSSYGA